MECLDRDLALAALSRRQFGATSTAQLIRIGFTPSSIRRAVERRRLVRVLPRVYRIVSVPVTLEQRLMSALLFGGDDAALSHSTAAIVHDLIPRRPSAIHIATSRRVASRTGVIVHRRVWLPGDPPVRLGPLVVTSPARTVLDLCGVKNRNSEMALDAALRMGKPLLPISTSFWKSEANIGFPERPPFAHWFQNVERKRRCRRAN